MYTAFAMMGAQAKYEEVIRVGRSDMVVSLGTQIIVMELKCTDQASADQVAQKALQHIRNRRGYGDKYLHRRGLSRAIWSLWSLTSMSETEAQTSLK